MNYQNVLVAVDVSEESEQVIAAAANFLKVKPEANAHIVTVIKPLANSLVGIDPSTVSATAAQLDELLYQQSIERLKEWRGELSLPQEHTHILRGNPADKIKSLAAELGTDVIIMGTHGRHGLGLLLGSTANGVLHGIQCDAITIRIKN